MDEVASTTEGQRSKSLATSGCDRRFWEPQPSPKTTTVTLAVGSFISVKHKGCSTDNKTKYSSIAQSVEQRTVNPWVVGSSPTWGAKKNEEKSSFFFISCSSAAFMLYYT